MKSQVLILKNGKGYNKGQLVESYVSTKKGIVSGKNYIPREDFVFLNEKLDKREEDEVRKIVKEMLKTMWWRLYTRSAFFV